MCFALRLTALFIAVGCFGSALVQAETTRQTDLPPTIRQALSEDAKAAATAIRRLRKEGPKALGRLIQLRERWQASGQQQDLVAKLESVIDRVGGQRYCSASHLFWHTDLEKAKAAARRAHKPILSLRMMGNLTDEFSCANSRFFRTTLYANEKISAMLRDQFVLHWQSVRPVPKVTIDFGDGRKLHRTLTGNSIHYVLDYDGQVIDGLPGLYSPKRFADWLTEMNRVVKYFNGEADLPKDFTMDMLMKYFHEQQLRRIVRQWEQDLARIPKVVEARAEAAKKAAEEAAAGKAPPAQNAARLAPSKAFVELAIINVVNQIPKLEKESAGDVWELVAALHAKDAALDEASIKLIRKQNPTAEQANQLSETKSDIEDPLLRLIGNLQTSIAVDTVRNEYVLHRKLHQWLADAKTTRNVEGLNERVYAELFLTPRTDPWIGLLPNGVYSALENNGIEAAP